MAPPSGVAPPSLVGASVLCPAATLLVVVALAFLWPLKDRDSAPESGPDEMAVAAAVAEARFALALVGKVSQQTGASFRENQLKPWVLTPLAAVVAPPHGSAADETILEEI